jgi:outer membrane protein OmpA-like peptidoglycan-associated protein
MLEIGCHTDSRGDDQYNQEISEKRAAAIRNYMLDQGILPSRLVAKGYGEEQIVNACTNGVRCTTEQHEENRRIIFTVISGVK